MAGWNLSQNLGQVASGMHSSRKPPVDSPDKVINYSVPSNPVMARIRKKKRTILLHAYYKRTSGFWPRVRARPFGRIATPNGALRAPPPIAASLLPPKIKINLFPETKCLPSGPNSGRQGHIFFHRAKLHRTELRCTPVSYRYAAPY
jgi:hypothetical protein